MKANSLVKAFNWLRVWSHVFGGLATLCFRFPFIGQPTKNKLIQNWSIHLLSILGIELRLKKADILPTAPFLLASNHISWVDIHAINAFQPIRFVAKSEVEGWPVFGWMAKQLGTIFINRNNSRHGKYIANEVAKALKTQSVCIFPEGTSTVGETVLPFKPNLFEAAVIAQVPVYSLAISYKSTESGERSDIPAFIGDMGLLESISSILSHQKLAVELTFILPSGSSPSASRDRKWLALYSQEAILGQLKGNQPLM
ncbi:lysophospholipid acyltransferase family protein [Polynucleobacter asymbioticus]|jgi:1-acyl-sn-glycerol-3-phosphate acyltransferase|uniref:Glycerol acyltransferase n=1 Tax=Polynucleobacter asymbioticus TaxID=576611 RepID=A0AAC9IYJ9_9BURK|nr:lysophospholipid acyltransferase family protein [Polynucleobacter asymbioticus]APB99465.1 glycerol acyltransferase [Polynucleobacter asymbioticus]APC01772.1 glycerol acyltransferase [Polynucleobacter asymbioticus]